MPPREPFPRPDPDALDVSRALVERLHAEIDAAGGFIGFDRYMELALYEPGLGYYSGGMAKLGRAGDFVTAPELGDWLARAIDASLGPWLAQIDTPAVLELGAGLGTLAAQLLDALDARGLGGVPYRILETSASLRARQQETLARFGDRVEWLDRLPRPPIDGVFLANEVADALPCVCFVKRNGAVFERGVRRGDGPQALAWAERPAGPALADEVARLEAALGEPLPDGFASELRPAMPAWLASLGDALATGAVMLIDYGYDRRDYYRVERSSGTLMCHYRHRAHGDPFLYPGLQDLTAWVDFSAAADAGAAAGLRVAGFTTQAQFLLESLGTSLATPADLQSPQRLAALKTLMLPGEMGERFKVLLMTRNAPSLSLPGRDLLARL